MGSVPEWLKGADCKSAGYAYVGSNLTRPKNKILIDKLGFYCKILILIKVETFYRKYFMKGHHI